jgi:hypothetical protein
MTAAENKAVEGDLDVIDTIFDPNFVGHSTLSPEPIRCPGESKEKDQKQMNLVGALHATHGELQRCRNMIRFILILAVVLLFSTLVVPVALAAANTTAASSTRARC